MKKYIIKLDTYEFGEFYESEIVDCDFYEKDEAERTLVYLNNYVKNEFDEYILTKGTTTVSAKIEEIKF